MIWVLKKYWPYLFLFLLWFVFSYKYFIFGKVPYPSTFQVNQYSPWNAYPKFWGPVKNAAMPDIITQIYPWRHFTIEAWKNGHIPLWNPYGFAGNPHLANYQSAVFFPGNVLFFILPFIDAWSMLVLLQPLLAGLFTYLFIRSLRISVVGSLISSISFMFCGFITVWMEYATLSYAILFLPLSLFGIEKYFESGKTAFLVLLALTIPLSFFSGHFQTSLYFLIFVLAYIVFKFITLKNLSILIFQLSTVFFGLLLSMPQILPSIELYLQSVRSEIFQKGEVIPWQYLPTLLAPDFYGNPVTRNDWFGHYAEWNSYIGIIPILLAIYVILRKKNSQTIFLLVIGVLSFLLAFNSPLVDLLVRLKVPVIGTSAASRIIVLFSFSMAVLAGLGFDKIFYDISKKKIRPIILWVAISFALFLTLWVIVGFGLLNLNHDQIRMVVAKRNLILPTAFLVAGFLLVLISVLIKKRHLLLFTSYLILIFVSFDMLRFAIKWMPFDPKNLVFPKTGIASFYPKISGVDRVFGNFTAENSVYYRLPSIEGYDPLYIERYGEFITSPSDGKVKSPERSVVAFPKNGAYTPKAVDLLGIKYVVHKISDGRNVWAFPYWTYPENQFKLIFDDGKFQVYENTKVFPRAFLLGKYRVVYDKQKIIDTMFLKNFDLRNGVVLEDDPKIKQVEEEVGEARIIRYGPNNIDVETNSNSDSILLLTDNFYPGWKATVDGQETQIFRADYTFRAIIVPRGEHAVQFTYDPFSFKLGLYLAGLGLIGTGSISILSRGVKLAHPRGGSEATPRDIF